MTGNVRVGAQPIEKKILPASSANRLPRKLALQGQTRLAYELYLQSFFAEVFILKNRRCKSDLSYRKSFARNNRLH